MGILAWVILGLVAGLIADFVLKAGLGIVATIVLGIVGALVGGFVSHQILGLGDVTGAQLHEHRHRGDRRDRRHRDRPARDGQSFVQGLTSDG